jgi:hypothetical protein
MGSYFLSGIGDKIRLHVLRDLTSRLIPTMVLHNALYHSSKARCYQMFLERQQPDYHGQHSDCQVSIVTIIVSIVTTQWA